MKEYEVYGDLKVPVNSRIILRLDGRSFHSLAKNLNLKKPYDEDFAGLMVKVSKDLFNEFAPAFIYTFSDEISVLLDNIPFNGRIEKIKGLKSSDIHELLFNEGINLNDVDNWKKRGIAIYKQNKEIVGYNKKENKNQVSYRSFLFEDFEIPIFSENFFKDINII